MSKHSREATPRSPNILLGQVTTNPINRLPPELLEEIVWLSAGQDSESLPQRRYYALSHVDRFWRQTIVKNSRFWTSLDLFWPLEVIEIILSRAGSFSKLLIRLVGNTHALSSTAEKAIQDILVSQSHRVETLHVTIDSSVAKKCTGTPFASLKNAILNDFPSQEGPDSRIPFLDNAANLQTLDISRCRVDLPWDQLFDTLRRIRRLKIRFNSRKSYTSFLLGASSFLNMQDLSVESLYGIDDDPEFEPRDPNGRLLRYPTHAFTLPNLQTLRAHSFNMPTLMTRLHTPSLRTYEVLTRKYGSSHVLRRHLHPIFEEFDYSAIKSLYVGFHVPCSGMCILGSEKESLLEIFLGQFPHSESDIGINLNGKGFHIQLFRSTTVEAFLPKSLALLLPRLSNLLQLSLRLHSDVCEVSETKTLLILHMLKHKPNRCPNLETIFCCFPDGPPLCESSGIILDILRKRIEYGHSKLKLLCLENYSVDEDLISEAGRLGVTATFNAPLRIC